MDKLRGMYNFTNYVDGEYHDSESDGFKLNPFSLADTNENRDFLKSWLCFMAEVKNDEHEAINDINNTIDRIYDMKQDGQTLTLSDFIISLPSDNNEKSRHKNQIWQLQGLNIRQQRRRLKFYQAAIGAKIWTAYCKTKKPPDLRLYIFFIN